MLRKTLSASLRASALVTATVPVLAATTQTIKSEEGDDTFNIIIGR